MSEKAKAASNVKRTPLLYALSIHMKYGEVLHVEGITKEDKERYIELARSVGQTMLVEDSITVRHLHSNDISKISVKAYDAEREKWMHPFQKMLFTESSLGRPLFRGVIKAFVWFSVLSIIGMFGLAMIEGNVFDVFFDASIFMSTLQRGFDFMQQLFKYAVILLILLNLLDLGLGLNASYFINQDGEEAPEFSRLSNVTVTAAFVIIFTIVRMVLNGLVNLV